MNTKTLLIVLSLLFTAPALANDPSEAEARAAQIAQRIKTIRSLDRSELERSEKKELKKELRTLKVELNELAEEDGLDNKVSISVGAIIIVILLLIIIL